MHVGVVRMRVVVQAHRQIAFARDDVSALVHPPADEANLAAVLLFAFVISGQTLSPGARCGLLPRAALSTARSDFATDYLLLPAGSARICAAQAVFGLPGLSS